MGRVHLGMGACSYLVSAVWAASLGVGVVLALQGQQMIPSYFQDSKTLFPIWPVMDPGAAMRLFLATMAVVLLPKALGLILEIKRAAMARELFGMPRAFAGVATETVFSILIAPILMMTQTAAVFEILLGRDSGWKAQRRDAGDITLVEAVRWHAKHTAAGVLLGLMCWWASPGLLLWMSPVVLGLVLSGPVHWLTARPAGQVLSALLSTDEERNPASIIERTARESEVWSRRLAGRAAGDAGVPGVEGGLIGKSQRLGRRSSINSAMARGKALTSAFTSLTSALTASILVSISSNRLSTSSKRLSMSSKRACM